MKKGTITITVSIILTFCLWILSKENLREVISFPLISINQLSALFGAHLFAWSMILASRLSFIKSYFGDWENVYKLHRKVSEYGFVFILMHPFFLAFNAMTRFIDVFLPFQNDNAINLGVISFWLFVYLIVITIFSNELKLKYNLWKNLHKLLNIVMILAFLHIIFIKSDVSFYFPLGIWMNTWMILGILSGLYKLFLYK